ncbi:response regulator [Marinobacterium jannaschii]|uniref:response regulator n=1 Tax=Marinobacterium jannaschii TaxID=64970 RepID=UPI00055F97D5|nr:response regulator [Marinobacterium jannaschii]
MKSINILLIEDNPGDVELTREALSSGKIRNHLEVVSDGEQALDYLRKQPPYTDVSTPDIILLDLNLPKVDGREVLQAVKSDLNLRQIPVIILSSSEAASDIQQSYDLHANCFISKPVQLDRFLDIVQMIECFWIDIVKLPGKG